MIIITAISLILDIIGVILLFIASDKLGSVISEITIKSAKTVGFWQDNPISSELLTRFGQITKKARVYNYVGLIFLVAGFSGQLLVALLK